MSNDSHVMVSSDPHTIWSLEEQERPKAVIEILKACACEFNTAVARDDAGEAQDMAIHALASIAGLFPDPNDGIHKMLQSLVGVFHNAKWGGRQHILLRASLPILGTKKGYGHAILGGFAISAVGVLTESWAMSGREARMIIAKVLADAGCSLRSGDHGVKKPITSSAIRNWIEKPNDYPTQQLYAAEMAVVHAANLKRRAATSTTQVIEYFKFHAQEMAELSRTI